MEEEEITSASDKELYIKESPTTPEVKFNFETGELEIKGVSIPEDTDEFYNPLLEALEDYLTNHNPEKITISFKLIYVNTSTSAVLGKIIKLLEPEESENRQVIVNWYYEMEDEDMKDLGEDFNSFTTLKFELIPCEEIS
jgi:SiaC family regulatory phosphoprotein